MKKILKRLLFIAAMLAGWTILLLVSAAAGWFAMLLIASFTAELLLFSALSILAVGCVALAGSWLMGYVFRFGRGTRWANAVLITIVLVMIARLVVFLPAHELYGPLQAAQIEPRPARLSYWDLPTGSRIAYQRFRPEQDKPKATVIWLHGGPGAYAVGMREIHPIPEQLAEMGYEVYLYDQIGGGLSARLSDPRDYTLDRHLRDLEAIQSHIGASSVTLIGSSWGATLAAHYIARNPDSVQAAVFNAPGEITVTSEIADAEQDTSPSSADEQAKTDWTLSLGLRSLLLDAIRLRQPALFEQLSSDAEWDEAMDYFLNRFVLDGAVCPDTSLTWQARGYGRYAHIYTQRDFQQQADDALQGWPGSDIPALVLRGECEFLSEQIVEQYQARFTALQVIQVPDAGHLIALEQPDALIEYLGTFLDQHAANPGRAAVVAGS